MPARPNPLLIVLAFFLFNIAVAMVTAFLWMIVQLLRGRSILPPFPEPPKIVPWKGGSIVLVLVIWLAAMSMVPVAYHLVRASFRGVETERTSRAGLATARPGQPPTTEPTLPAAGSAGRTSPGSGPEEKDRPPFTLTEQMFLMSLVNGIFLVAIPAALRLTAGAEWADLGVTADHLGRNLRMGAVAFLLCTPVVMAMFGVAQRVWSPNRHPLELMLRAGAGPGGVVLAYLASVVLAPAAEELIFRGVIQAWFRKVLLGKPDSGLVAASSPEGRPDDDWTAVPPVPRARPLLRLFPRPPKLIRGFADAPGVRRSLPVVLTSLFFAAAHFPQMPAPLALFPLALVLGLLYEVTGSLVPSIVLHAMFNGFNTTLLLGALLGDQALKGR